MMIIVDLCLCRTMSNTAPAYLESFQRIVISVDEISGPDDIKHFVGDHKDLTSSPEFPVFERHPYMTGEAVRLCTVEVHCYILMSEFIFELL